MAIEPYSFWDYFILIVRGPYLHIEPTEEDYHPRIICIDGGFDAGEQFREAPFIAWRHPYFALLLGIAPLLASVPVLIDSERAADYFARWPFYLHLGLGFFWLILGGGILFYRYWIYRRSKHRR